jgi:all-trans-8'-apo-beta-carotenal 15,15'-oxygenase
LSAHPRFDANLNRMVTFTTERSPSVSTLNCIEFDPDLKVMTQRKCEVPGFVFFHDFIVTKNWYIFDQAPVKFNPLPFLLGAKGPAQCIDFDPSKPAVIHLIPRDLSKEYQKIEVDSHFNFHFANAFEDDDGKVMFDIVRCSKMTLGDTSKSANPIWEDIDYAKEVPYSVLSRYTLTPPPPPSGAESKSKWAYSCKDLSKTQVDFTSVSPSVSCKKHRYVYASCGSDLSKSTPVQGVVKIDTIDGTEQKWFGEKHEYMGEAIFIPRIKTTERNLDEDDGYVFTLLFNGKSNTAEFLIFDAQKISEGPISRQSISTNIPYGLHGTWADGLTFPEDDINRKWKAAVSIESKNWGEVKSDFSGLGISFGS